MVGIIVNPPPVIFGRRSSQQLAGLVNTKTFSYFHGSSDERHLHLLAPVMQRSKVVGGFSIVEEPDVSVADEAAEALRATKAELVLAIGGGSVLDAAKAAAALATNPGRAVEYLEEVRNRRLLVNDPLPVVAVPTTFGTGSEATDKAVLKVIKRGLKATMRDERMKPRHSLIDSLLGSGLSEFAAATSGFAAMSRVCEAYVCREPSLENDEFCEGAIRDGFEVLVSGASLCSEEPRNEMAKVSMAGGMMTTCAKLGAVDAFAGAIGGLADCSYSAICAALFAEVFRANIKAIGDRVGYGLDRYATISEFLTGKREPMEIPDRLEELASQRGLPRLRDFGLRLIHHGRVVEAAKREPSMKGNPIDLTDSELAEILERST